MSALAASVIVRTKNKVAEIERALTALRSQTVPAEIIVVDSGSTDGTVEIAKRHCDRLIEIAPEEFTYGHALNLGAAAAGAPIHFALSSHCYPERDDWIERSLRHYEREDVAGTSGYGRVGPAEPSDGVVYQDLALLEAAPFQGLSSHASSWRGSLWERFPYHEGLESAEDREWSWRVLKEGYVIAMDPELGVATRHRTAGGLRHWYRISRRDVRAVATFMPVGPYTRADVIRDWWDIGPLKRRFGLRARISPWRMLSLAARYRGIQDGARVRRGEAAPWKPGDPTV
jgi:glycosyltransferase involved in cell wall biosynthesis